MPSHGSRRTASHRCAPPSSQQESPPFNTDSLVLRNSTASIVSQNGQMQDHITRSRESQGTMQNFQFNEYRTDNFSSPPGQIKLEFDQAQPASRGPVPISQASFTPVESTVNSNIPDYQIGVTVAPYGSHMLTVSTPNSEHHRNVIMQAVMHTLIGCGYLVRSGVNTDCM